MAAINPRAYTELGSRIPDGTAIWFSCAKVDGSVVWHSARIVSWNRLSGSYLVAPDDPPMRGKLVGGSRIRRRRAGETAPGVTGGAS